MKERLKNLSNKKIVITSLCAFVLVLVLGFTYAYWTRTFSQTGENISSYDCFDISFTENSEGIAMDNGYPISDEEGLQTESYEVTITNICKTPASYNVVLNKLNTSTLDNSHIKVAVDGNVKLLSETSTTTSNVENISEARIIGTGVLGSKETKTIKVQNWMDENTSETDGVNKKLSYKITIEAVATKEKFLAEEILKEKLQTATPNFIYGEPPTILYREALQQDQHINLNIINSVLARPVGTGYEFDKYTGKYNLTNVQQQKYDESSIDKYTCTESSEGVNCNIIYKIKQVELYNGYYMCITKADIYTSETQQVTSEDSGLYKTEDADGESYYYRGAVNNNYVSFANNLWRIVRINGDNSIRLILDDTIGKTMYSSNLYSDNDKATAYTRFNAEACTSNSPCTSESGTSSEVKEYLDNWYGQYLSAYDKYLVASKYCNDTTFETYGKLDKANPSLICPDTSVDYGGLYSLKIGLLSADEMMFAGLGWDENINDQNYLYKDYDWWSMTPGSKKNVHLMISSIQDFSLDTESAFSSLDVRPVINLKENINVIDGDGTKNNPYVIE